MLRWWRVAVVAVLIAGVGCRLRPAAGPAPTASPAAETRSTPTATAAPTPTPALREWSAPGVSPQDLQEITPENVAQLRPIWRSYHMVVENNLWAGPDQVVALGSNGLWIFSPADLKLRKWIPLPAGTEFPTAVAVRPDGREAVVGTRDGALFEMDLETGEIRARAQITAHVRAMAYMDAEGRRVAVLADGLRIWETGGQVSMPTSGVPREDYAGALSPDGQLGVVVDAQGRGALWEVASGRAVLTFTVPFTSPRAAALHPQGRYVAVAGREQVVVLRTDRAGGRSEVVQTLRFADQTPNRLAASTSLLGVLSDRKVGSDVWVYRWGEGQHIFHLQPSHRLWALSLDPSDQMLYVAIANRLEAFSISKKERVATYQGLPTRRGLLLEKHRKLVLGGWTDVFFRDLWSETGFPVDITSDFQAMWKHPQEEWVAVAQRDGTVMFLDPQGADLRKRIEAGDVRWIGVDAQGRGMIGLRRNEVVLWAPGEPRPRWRRSIPLAFKDAELIGAVSDEWIAVTGKQAGKTIWLLDFNGNIRYTIENQDFHNAIRNVKWDSGDLLVYLFYKDKRIEVWVMDVPSGQRLAFAAMPSHIKRGLPGHVNWWPDQRLMLIEYLGAELAALEIEAPNVAPRLFSLVKREDMWIVGSHRLGNSRKLLVSAQQVRYVWRGEQSVTARFRRGGWLWLLDVDAQQILWERELPYSPVWMVVDPEEKWVILGGADGALEAWAVPKDGS
ncbi:hypothetical protein [Thermoflexus sp.]|uniref:WD40 repeat domain-containing protein n=1 Tax=Thermoflexus sp. TaxID=1969742 RepID=UPI002ADD76C0|nr:hypothetical protein [Thermoflexus sp.]